MNAPVLPLLDRDEVEESRDLVGRGSFCTVHAVRRIRCLSDPCNERGGGGGGGGADGKGDDYVRARAVQFRRCRSARQRLTKRFADGDGARGHERGTLDPTVGPGRPRYVVKRPRVDLDGRNATLAVQDIGTELDILTRARGHPYIIGLHGYGATILSGDSDESGSGNKAKIDRTEQESDDEDSVRVTAVQFIVLDRLRSTLRQRLYRWRGQRGVGLLESLGVDVGGAGKNSWLERMIVLERIASAISYLHKNGIIYRDLKSDNVGFDYDDTPKLFDFGLARVLPLRSNIKNAVDSLSRPSDDTCVDDGGGGGDANMGTNSTNVNLTDVYEMTGDTGSRRYMAPEVAWGAPYNTSVDVYSLSILAYEVLSLRVPFGHLGNVVSESMFFERVVVGGGRPTLEASWPGGLTGLLAEMWDSDCYQRPSADEVLRRMGELLRGSDEELFPRPLLGRRRREWFIGSSRRGSDGAKAKEGHRANCADSLSKEMKFGGEDGGG